MAEAFENILKRVPWKDTAVFGYQEMLALQCARVLSLARLQQAAPLPGYSPSSFAE